MSKYSLTHLADSTLIEKTRADLARERGVTAEVLADLAEIDSRRLYLPAAYPSMHAYCVGFLEMSDDAADRRIRAARAALAFPALFDALEDGRLHLTAILLIAPHLTAENADELMVAACGRTREDIEAFLRRRRQPTLMDAAAVEAVPVPPSQPTSWDTDNLPALARVVTDETLVATEPTPRYRVHLDLDEQEQAALTYAKALLGHEIPSGNVRQIFMTALRHLIRHRERRKFGIGAGPRRRTRQASRNPRTIPSDVREAVHARDAGRCTFVSDNGRRCEAITRLEYDHIVPVNRGGESTAGNLRLLCRAHNQHAAELTYGAEFMRQKRESAKTRAKFDPDLDVTPWLRSLGVRPADAKRAEAHVASMTSTTLEERVKAALAFVAPPHKKIAAG